MTNVTRYFVQQNKTNPAAIDTNPIVQGGSNVAIEYFERPLIAAEIGTGQGQTRDPDETGEGLGLLVGIFQGPPIISVPWWIIQRPATLGSKQCYNQFFIPLQYYISNSASGKQKLHFRDTSAAGSAPNQLVAGDIIYYAVAIGYARGNALDNPAP